MSDIYDNLTISCQACVSAPAEPGKYTFRDTDQVWLCRHRMDERLHPLVAERTASKLADDSKSYIVELMECRRELAYTKLRLATVYGFSQESHVAAIQQLHREKESLSAKLDALARERDAALAETRYLRAQYAILDGWHNAACSREQRLREALAAANAHVANSPAETRLTDIVICERCCPSAGGVFLLHKGFKCAHAQNPSATNDPQATNKAEPTYNSMPPEVVLAYEPLLEGDWTFKTPGAADMLAAERQREAVGEDDQTFRNEWTENGIRGVSFPSERRKVGDVLAEFDRHKAESQAKPQEPQQSGWISVEESLPDKDSLVNVYIGGEVASAWYFPGQGNWNSDEGVFDQTKASERVTHWMPLPPAPK